MKQASPFLLLIAAAGMAACTDRTPLSAPAAPVPAGVAQQLSCVASVASPSIHCAEGSATTAFRAAILGGQGENVLLTSGEVTFDPATGILQADVDLQNLLPYPVGLPNFVGDPHPIKVFFHQGPTATEGNGAVHVLYPDGVSAFTAANQPYYGYFGPLAAGAVSYDKTWRFQLDPGVTRFAFSVYVQARVAPTAFRVLAPAPLDTVDGDSVTIRVLAPAPPAVAWIHAELGETGGFLAYADSGRWEGRLSTAGLTPGTQALRIEASDEVRSTVEAAAFELRANFDVPHAIVLGTLGAASGNGVVAGRTLDGHIFRWSRDGGLELLPRTGGWTNVSGISPNGRFVIGYARGLHASFLWTAGEPLRKLPGYAVAVNDAGTVAGDADSGRRLFRWSAARGMEAVAVVDGYVGGITATGLVVAKNGSLWAPSGTLVAKDFSTSLRVHPNGMVGGTACEYVEDPWDEIPTCWPFFAQASDTGYTGARGFLFYDTDVYQIFVSDVNGSGVVVGGASPDGADDYTYQWRTDGDVEYLGDHRPSWATAVNERGDIAGCTGRYDPDRAVVWTPDGTMHRLPRLSGELTSCAYAIDDERTVVGISWSRAGARVVRWPRMTFDADTPAVARRANRRR